MLAKYQGLLYKHFFLCFCRAAPFLVFRGLCVLAFSVERAIFQESLSFTSPFCLGYAHVVSYRVYPRVLAVLSCPSNQLALPGLHILPLGCEQGSVLAPSAWLYKAMMPFEIRKKSNDDHSDFPGLGLILPFCDQHSFGLSIAF